MTRAGYSRITVRRSQGCSCWAVLFVLLLATPGCIGAAVGIAAASAAIGIVPASMTGVFPFNIFDPGEIMKDRLGIELRDLGDNDPKRFDPVAALPYVQSFAGEGAELLSIRAMGVRADGTVDLTASYRPTVTYDFVRRVPQPENAPPLGAPGHAPGEWQEKISVEVQGPGQSRRITSIGGSGSTEIQYVTKGMEREAEKPVSAAYPKVLPAPACGFAVLWSIARERGTPADAVAVIEYGKDGFTFSVTGTSFRFTATPDCAVR